MPLFSDVNHLYRYLVKGSPFTDYEYVDVTFPAVANTDQEISHALESTDVDWEVVRKDRACDVYRDPSVSARLADTNYIVLRCSVANAVVTLRLSTRR